MSSFGVCGVQEYNPETPTRRDGPDKVVKSVSLQEMRPSLRDIDLDASGEAGHSSGVFSCSVDISDVCMADLTKLSDSTVCSSAESVNLNGDSTPNLLNSAVMSTPLTVPLLRSIDVLTPMRSSDCLSPQFGASDDYLRRNIKFIYKQLGSLMTQLRTEDKYFQTCSQRYEEVISHLEDEIVALKSAKPSGISVLQPADEDVEEPVKEPGEPHAKNILRRIAHDLLPQLRSMILTASENLPSCPDPAGLNLDLEDFRNLPTVFDKCLSRLDKIFKAYTGVSQDGASVDAKLTDSGTESLSSFHEDDCAKKRVADLETRVGELETANDSLQSACRASQLEIARITVENVDKSEAIRLQSDLDKITQTLANTKDDLDNARTELLKKSSAYDSLVRVNHSERAEIENKISSSTIELSKANRELTLLADDNKKLKETVDSNENEMSKLVKKLRDLETEHKTVVEEFRIKGSSLILENSKLKEELNTLHGALTEARESAEKSTEKFSNLQKTYQVLIEKMASKEREFGDLEGQKAVLEGLLRAKDSVLGRLCSNFNELLAIFRECQDLGLDRDSSATDIDDGFIRLKRRLLDLSQDYITLNNRNKVLEKEATVMTAKLKEKELESGNLRKKYDNRTEKLQRTLEKLEEENKALVAENIAQDEATRKMKAELKKLEVQEAKGCQDCGHIRNQLQQLQIDLVDKDSTISTLELHIQSCCEYNRKKAQQYKHELHNYKKQLDANSSYAVDFGLSPKKSKCVNPKVDVGIQSGESFLHHHTGGFVERFKIRELEEKVMKLEKERTVLKRLCKVRSDRIHELESQSIRSSSHPSK